MNSPNKKLIWDLKKKLRYLVFLLKYLQDLQMRKKTDKNGIFVKIACFIQTRSHWECR